MEIQYGTIFRGRSVLTPAKYVQMVGETAIEKFKLYKWYAIVLYIGILAAGSSMIKGDDFLSRKHLMGFGLGCILIGLSFFIAQKQEHYSVPDGLLSRDITKHNWISIPILLTGIFLIGFFGIKIFGELQ
jgi:dipeptide/tripeptide permease